MRIIMPKQRITRQMVMDAAFELLREGGESHVLVKSIASRLECSVQPIYSYFDNMESLRLELAGMAGDYLSNYVAVRIQGKDPFVDTGKAYVDFAKEEPHLFKSYFLRKRPDIASFDELYKAEASQEIAGYLAGKLGITRRQAIDLHMNMIIATSGISFLLISTGGNLPQQDLYDRLDQFFQAFLGQIKNQGGKV
jgi:AcrR family transcriptional regulator